MSLQRAAVSAWIALLALALGLSSGRRHRAAWASFGLATLGLVVQLAARWIEAGRPPVFGTYETDLAETLLLLLATPLVARRAGPAYLRGPAWVGLLTLAHTFTLHAAVTPLTISELSLWIDLHAPLAWLAWCLYFHALFLCFSPAQATLALRLLGAGFWAHSAMGFVGVYYATLLFDRPWSWDPIQTGGLLSWVLFAFSLHLRLFYSVSLHRQRYFLLCLLLLFVVSAKLVILLPQGQSFHVFELGRLAGPR